MTTPDPTEMVSTQDEAGDRELALKLWVVLSRAHESITTHLNAEIARHDLTLMEFGILEVLFHKGPLLLGDVQRRILVSSGGITYLVDRLEAKGLVARRTCDHDRRARYATLTAEGEAFIGRIFPEHAGHVESLMSELSREEKQQVIGLLRRLGRSVAERPLP
jgi:MarR family 2-MHQ and catechol resistance regulon transcriptional repressor